MEVVNALQSLGNIFLAPFELAEIFGQELLLSFVLAFPASGRTTNNITARASIAFKRSRFNLDFQKMELGGVEENL